MDRSTWCLASLLIAGWLVACYRFPYVVIVSVIAIAVIVRRLLR